MWKTPFFVQQMFPKRKRNEDKHNYKENAASYDTGSFRTRNEIGLL